MITSKIYSTFILAIMSTIAFAQTEQPQDSVTGHRRTVPEIRQELHHSDRKIQSDNNLPEETLHSATGDSMTFRMPHIENIPSGWIIPQLGTSFNPFIWDYNRYNEFDLSGNSYLSTFSNHNTYLSIGTIIKQVLSIPSPQRPLDFLGRNICSSIYNAKLAYPHCSNGRFTLRCRHQREHHLPTYRPSILERIRTIFT